MLPNFKIVIGGVLIFVLLFAVTGAGVVTPQIYTRIGAMPEIGRPMMQRVFADESALAHPHRSDELRLRELAALLAIPEPQVAPDLDEETATEGAADEKSEAAAEPIVAIIAAVSAPSAVPATSGTESITVPSPTFNAKEPIAAATAAPTVPNRPAGPTGAFADASIANADRAEPSANEKPQARPAARHEAAEAHVTKSPETGRSTGSGFPKRNRRAPARKHLAAAHRVHPSMPAPMPSPAYNFFGQPSSQSHF